MDKPLVSVICLCFNHGRFLKEALDSVLAQTYPNLEIIVVDDFSTDNSRELLKTYAARYSQITCLLNEKNLGNCASFNRAFAISKGEYLIDFATDDEMFPTRIAEQIEAFQNLGPEYGVVFTDAELIDESGKHAGYFYRRNADGSLKVPVPSGNVFAAILRRYFVSTPTMIMRREVLQKMGGYDATLAYEDFDLWVRSSREFRYFFLDKILTKRRLHPAQLSKQQYQPNDQQVFSTIKVCRKALTLIRTEEEKAALITRIQHELIQAVFTQNQEAADQYFALLEEMNALSPKFKLLKMVGRLPLPLTRFRQLYYALKYGK